MTFSDYEKIISKVTYKNSDFKKLERLLDNAADNENITN